MHFTKKALLCQLCYDIYMPADAETARLSGDELPAVPPVLSTFKAHSKNHVVYEEPLEESGDSKIIFHAKMSSCSVDLYEFIDVCEEVPLEWLLLRQKTLKCSSAESVSIDKGEISNYRGRSQPKMFKGVQLHPDYATLERSEDVDESIMKCLAFSLAMGACGGVEVNIEDQAKRLYETAESLGVAIDLRGLRLGLLHLAEKDVVEELIKRGTIKDDGSELPLFFQNLSEWQLALAKKVTINNRVVFTTPFLYAATLSNDVESAVRSKKGFVVDLRFAPYLFKTHLRYLTAVDSAPGSFDKATSLNVISGVQELYATVDASLNACGADATAAEVRQVAGDYRDVFTEFTVNFFKKHGGIGERTDSQKEGGIYSSRGRGNDIRAYGGKGHRTTGGSFAFRSEAKGLSD